MGYGFSDPKEKNTSSLHFGLNSKFYLKQFKLEKDDKDRTYLQIVLKNDADDEIKTRFYEVTRAFGKEGKIIENREHPRFQNEVDNQAKALIHIVSAYASIDTIKEKLSELNDNATFEEFIRTLQSVFPSDFQSKPIDVFLQYQATIKGSSTRTFLELPQKLYYGEFFVSHMGTGFKETRDLNVGDNDIALKYEKRDGENIILHRFTRTGKFMRSNRAKMQSIEKPANTNSNSVQGSDIPNEELPF